MSGRGYKKNVVQNAGKNGNNGYKNISNNGNVNNFPGMTDHQNYVVPNDMNYDTAKDEYALAKRITNRIRFSTITSISIFLIGVVVFAGIATISPNFSVFRSDGVVLYCCLNVIPVILLLRWTRTNAEINAVRLVFIIHTIITFVYGLFLLIHGVVLCQTLACQEAGSNAFLIILFILLAIEFFVLAYVSIFLLKYLQRNVIIMRDTSPIINRRYKKLGGLDNIIRNYD